MSITLTSDFTGEVNISKNKFTVADLQAYIDRVEEDVLKKMLGDTLYLTFKADSFGNDAGSRDRFKELLNGLEYTDPSDSTYTIDYIGLKRMLRLFVYAEYLPEQAYQNTIIGEVEGSSRNAFNTSITKVNETAEDRQRLAVDLYDAAQRFISDYNDKEYIPSSIVDQNGNVYLVSLGSTKYIQDGDSIDINGTDYVVSNLVTDTSFEISETSGTVFPSDSIVKFELYPTYKGKEKKKVFFRGMF
tara:strand:- start:324 stop:1058 length:735 start_codon:yes stop_codon:yes gene_type:complete